MRDGFIRVVALPAGPGDCLWIEYGREGEPARVMLVDTGVPRTLEFIKPRLAALPPGAVTALVVTHIDDDHIGSATELLSDPELADKIQDVWFNGRRHCGPGDEHESFGVKRAIALDVLLGNTGQRWNLAFDGQAAVLSGEGLPRQLPELEGGMRVTVLGPSPEQLRALGRLWDCGAERLLERQVAKSAMATDLPSGMEAFGASPAFEVDTLSAYVGVDSSVTNGSSISLLLEFCGRRIVLAADSHAAALLDAWQHLGIAEVDLLKVSHHGSRNNTSKQLIDALRPEKVLICSDGSRHGHPDDECIAMLVAPVGPKQILTNYTYEKIDAWNNAYLKRKYNFTIVSGDGAIEVEL